MTITTDGNLTVTLTNGAALSLGNIKGADGIGITKSEINAGGHLVLTYSDGNSTDLGKVVGANGTNGADGQDGIGISDVKILTDGTLTITLSDGSTKSLGNIKGEKGDKGDKGEKGDKGDPGENGKDGRGIAKTELVNGELIITYTDGTSDNLGSVNAKSEDDKNLSMYVFTLLNDDTYAIGASESFNLSVAKIPETYNGKDVTQIAENGFANLDMLTEVVLSQNIKKVGSHAFENSAVDTVNIPLKLTTIKSYAFYNCPLKYVDISSTATWSTDTGTFPFYNDTLKVNIRNYRIALSSEYGYQYYDRATGNYKYETKCYYKYDWSRLS